MQSELTLNTKCPACGTLKPKTLDALKSLNIFACDCGFHAPIQRNTRTMADAATRKRKASVAV